MSPEASAVQLAFADLDVLHHERAQLQNADRGRERGAAERDALALRAEKRTGKDVRVVGPAHHSLRATGGTTAAGGGSGWDMALRWTP